jgi:hypothetical protein
MPFDRASSLFMHAPVWRMRICPPPHLASAALIMPYQVTIISITTHTLRIV